MTGERPLEGTAVRYDHRHRPAQPPTPAPDAFEIHRGPVADGLELAYVREGVGGYPLLLIHGYPETKRIWWRNIEPLAAAGFEVIAVDLRGVGDSDVPADDVHDIGTYAMRPPRARARRPRPRAAAPSRRATSAASWPPT